MYRNFFDRKLIWKVFLTQFYVALQHCPAYLSIENRLFAFAHRQETSLQMIPLMTLSGAAIENALSWIKNLANFPILKSTMQLLAHGTSEDPGPEPAEPLLDRKTISLPCIGLYYFYARLRAYKVISFSRSNEVNYASEEFFELIQLKMHRGKISRNWLEMKI